uniref:RRM domain-containing protein n=1 Tax=Ditylenchus dipsaci TaxID=166011 RepID=A0A915EDY9_9BILA
MGGSNRYSPYGQPYNQRNQDMGGGYGYGGRGGGYGGRGGDPYGPANNASPTKVFIRGLPFRVTGKEIEDFFAPLVCVNIQVGTLGDGRSSGDGIVEFQTPQDANQALAKDRQNIGSRYVELFLSTNTKIPAQTRYDSIGGKGHNGGAGGYEDMWGPPAPPRAAPLGHDRVAGGAPSYYGNGNGAGPGYGAPAGGAPGYGAPAGGAPGYGAPAAGYGGGYGNGNGLRTTIGQPPTEMYESWSEEEVDLITCKSYEEVDANLTIGFADVFAQESAEDNKVSTSVKPPVKEMKIISGKPPSTPSSFKMFGRGLPLLLLMARRRTRIR